MSTIAAGLGAAALVITLAPAAASASECYLTGGPNEHLCCSGANPSHCDDGDPPLRDGWGTVPYAIPIYLVQDGPDFAGVSHSRAIHQLRIAIRVWHETSGGDFFPYYAGTLSSVPDYYAATVVVDDTSNCDACSPGACEKDIPFDFWGIQWGSKIVVKMPEGQPGGCTGVEDWHTGDGYFGLSGLFIHELGHSFSLGDEYLNDNDQPLCGTCVPNSAMAYGYDTKYGKALTRRDITVFKEVTTWGLRQEQYEALFSYDGGLTWSPGLADDVSGSLYQGSLGVAATTREVLAIATFGVFAPGYTNALVGHTGFSFTTVVPLTSSSHRSWDVAGAAVKSTSEYAIAYRVYEWEDRARKAVALSSYSSERGWHTRDGRMGVGEGSVEDTLWAINDGVSLAYDQSSDLYIAAISGDQRLDENGLMEDPTSDELILAAWREQSGQREWGTFVLYAASHMHPAIACGEHGTYNCMLAWQNKAAIPSIDYLRFRATATGIQRDPAGIATLHYSSEMPPTLAATDDPDHPFLLGNQQGVTFYLYEYDASSNSWSHLSTPLYKPDGMLQPALGKQGSALMLRYAPL